MAMQTIEELFEHELKDMYSAEHALLEALEQMAGESSDRDIRKAFTILDRIGMSVELVPMLMGAVTPAAGAALRPMPTGQRGFYAHWRNNSKVVDPNAVRILKGHA